MTKWHPTALKRQETFKRKMAYFRQLGRVNIMKGCEWSKMKKSIQPPPNGLGRLFEQDTEETLLEAIKSGVVFGFIIADVRTPNSIIEQHKRDGFLFPPVITRRTLTNEHLSPFMAQRYTEEGRTPAETVIQSYHGDQVFLLTSLVQFYLENGIQVSNITKFIQYQPGKALKPFVEKVTRMRIEATKDGDDSKGMVAKLTGNSGKNYTI